MSILAPENQVINKKVVPTPINSLQNNELIEFIYQNHPPEGVDLRLSDLSKRDSLWDTQRAKTSVVGEIYAMNSEFTRYGERMNDCSGFLGFGLGEAGLKLKQASFCRVRYCPVCQWRRSLLWKANMYIAYEDIREKYPTHRWLFLTLTVKNCEVTDLRSTLQHMNASWKRLINRKQFMNVVDGWIRTTEVTRGKDGTAHPHFHVMLLVKPSYFSHGYVKQADWVRLWADVLRVDYAPMVNIKVVKAKKKDEYTEEEAVKYAIMETLKYSVKPSDMMDDYDWFYEVTKQTHKLRFVASGGALKNALKSEKEITEDDLIVAGDDVSTTDDRRWMFIYNKKNGYYSYKPQFNE